MKKALIYLWMSLIGLPASKAAGEDEKFQQLIGIWSFNESVLHYSRQIQKDHFFGAKDEIRFYEDEGFGGSVGITLRSEDRECSIGFLYFIWVAWDQRGLILKFGSDIDPIIFVGFVNGDKLRFEFVSHGETRVEYWFDRVSNDPGERPKNSLGQATEPKR